MRNVFVLGLDPANLQTLYEAADVPEVAFHPLLSVAELIEAEELPLNELLERAEEQLEDAEHSIDAIVGYWDFPVSSMVPILCERFGLRSATLEAVLKCEHKYWSRLEQHASIEDLPNFALVDLDDDPPRPDLKYPMWIKPVKAFSSELAFRVNSEDELRDALDTIKAGIGRVGEPFQHVLDHAQLPREITDIGAQACLAEEAVSGQQVTVEGYKTGPEAEPHIYGIIDSHNYPGTSSFQHYQYPSSLPEHVQQRLADTSRQVINRIGLDSVAFNIEYFWNSETGAINLLEINPRHSQSHAILFELVDGAPNHQCMVRLALGMDPDLPYRQGDYAVAAKWFVRRFTDGVVRSAPSDAELAELHRSIPGCGVELLAGEGDRLANLPEQDPHSFAYATVHVGAADEQELAGKYEQAVANLPFEFSE